MLPPTVRDTSSGKKELTGAEGDQDGRGQKAGLIGSNTSDHRTFSKKWLYQFKIQLSKDE